MARYVELGGVRTWYDETGTGEPLVLLHPGGGGVDSRAFAPNLPALAERFHFRAHGGRDLGPALQNSEVEVGGRGRLALSASERPEPGGAPFIESALAPVLKLESRQCATLLRTLDVYYQTFGNRAETARKLGVHINTLYHRLERLTELVGPLDDPSRAVPFQVAMLAQAMNREL